MIIHTTKDHEEIPLPLMTDSHLECTLNLFINKLEKCKKAILKSDNDDFFTIVYGSIGIPKREAKTFIANFEVIISSYLVEAILRDLTNLDIIKDRINNLLERKKFLKLSKIMHEIEYQKIE